MSRASRTVKPVPASATSAGSSLPGRPHVALAVERRPVLRRDAASSRGRVVSGASATDRERRAAPAAATSAAPGIQRRCEQATTAAAASSTTAPTASTWSVPNSGTSQNAVANVPAMLPAVEIEKSRPAVRPSRSSERAASRTAIGETEASTTLIGPKRIDRGDERVEPRAGIPGDDLLEHPLVDDAGSRATSTAPSAIAPTKQVRRRQPVGERRRRPSSRSTSPVSTTPISEPQT